MKLEKKLTIIDKHEKLGTIFKSWQSSFTGVYGDQHYNQYSEILNLAFQSTQLHIIVMCAGAKVSEIVLCA